MPVIKTGFGKVKDVDSSELPTYRKLKTRRGFKTTKDFIELIRSTGRDYVLFNVNQSGDTLMENNHPT